jgi:hypothetical protein
MGRHNRETRNLVMSVHTTNKVGSVGNLTEEETYVRSLNFTPAFGYRI